MSKELKRVAALIEANKDEEAREILSQVLKAEPGNDEALVWMASITPNKEERKKYLEEALKYNPQNQIARKTLQKMNAPLEVKADNVQEQKPSALVHILCGWPLILVFFGGAIGGALGGIAYGINMAIYKSSLPAAAKYILIPVVGLSAIGLWLVIAMMIVS